MRRIVPNMGRARETPNWAQRGLTNVPNVGIFSDMKLASYLKDAGLDDEAFAQRSKGRFSAEAVRKWRFGVRVPRPQHMALIAELTAGAVTANDFMSAPSVEQRVA